MESEIMENNEGGGEYRLVIGKREAGRPVLDLLARLTGLSKIKLKDAMNKGALWRQGKGRGANERLRRATSLAAAGDLLVLYYDAKLLAVIPPKPKLIHDSGRYSIWNKPAGLLSQGTSHGDHCSLLRLAEIYFTPRRQVYLVHRLDREAQGLMLIAHDQAAAAAFGRMFQEGGMVKRYLAVVKGLPLAVGESGVIAEPLDGSEAKTEYRVLHYDQAADRASLDITLHTGRKHQIRRHLAGIGHAVLGDPRYGKDNSCPEGLQLVAFALSFRCPFGGGDKSFGLEPNELPLWRGTEAGG